MRLARSPRSNPVWSLATRAHGHFLTVGRGVRSGEACAQVRSQADWTVRWRGPGPLGVSAWFPVPPIIAHSPILSPTPTFILIPDRSSPTVVTRGGEILKFPATNSLHFFFFFCLDHSFWQGQRATVAWGFKCTFLDCSRETPDWRANSTGTGRREPEPESPHPPHLEPFSPWGTSRDYLPSASASGRASHTRPLRHVPVLPPSSPPLLQRVPPRQRPGGLTG